jgi:starvation-inducible DNA-binding protein
MSSIAETSIDHKKEIVRGLSTLLADTYTLYLKTHNFHWNVQGPMFQPLHQLFEDQYTELATAVDEVAERIRALGEFAPASYAAFSKLTSVKEAAGPTKSQDMIRQLLEGHEIVARSASNALPAAEKAGDQGTLDLLTQRLRVHEKTAWMLRSFLEA